MAQHLLHRGADINEIEQAPDYPMRFKADLGTPLYCAAGRGDEEQVMFLLERGADRGKRSTGGRTAVERARINGFARVAELLEGR